MTTYDVALSFAGAQREYVDAVAATLRESGIKIFYDRFEVDRLWGKDLGAELDRIYRKDSAFVVIFVSAEYAEKNWTRHEFRSALSAAIQKREEYVLPVRFDDTDLEGLPPTTAYVRAADMLPNELANLLLRKLRDSKPRMIPALDIWKVVAKQNAKDPFSPLLASRLGGRWSQPGTAVVYTSTSLCLAVIEASARFSSPRSSSDFIAFGAKIGLSQQPTRMSMSELPTTWSVQPPGRHAREVGTKWANSHASAVLLLPSRFLPSEEIALLNPAHPDFKSLTVFSEQPVQLLSLPGAA